MEAPPEDVTRLLGPNERVEMYIRQRIYHPKINISSVVITNERVILRHPHALGIKKDYTDYNYQDISNVVLDRGIMRSTLKFTLRMRGDTFALSDLPNEEAQKAYGIVRENLVRYQTPFSAGQQGVMPYQQTVGAAPPEQAARFCTKCGAPASAGQKFCGSCGAAL
jgi:Bacterial PH domain/zinc-ribbon domain